MSREDVELVRRLYAEQGPFALPLSPDDERALLDHLFRDYYDERLEVRMPADYPEGAQVLRGRAGMLKLLAMLRETWTEFRFEAQRFIAAGDRVTVFIRVLARGGASGLATERETAHVWAVRDGRLSSIQIYRDREEALDAVSRENVGLTLQAFDAFNKRDWDAFLALMDDEVEIESRQVAIEGSFHGHRGLRRWWTNFVGAFPDYTVEVEQLRDLGDVTLGHIRGSGHGAGSHMLIVDLFWQPIRWREGKCVWWRNCSTEAEALEAVRLRAAAEA